MNTPIDSNTRERMRRALTLLKGAAARLEARHRTPVDVAVDAVDAALGGDSVTVALERARDVLEYDLRNPTVAQYACVAAAVALLYSAAADLRPETVLAWAEAGAWLAVAGVDAATLEREGWCDGRGSELHAVMACEDLTDDQIDCAIRCWVAGMNSVPGAGGVPLRMCMRRAAHAVATVLNCWPARVEERVRALCAPDAARR